MTSEALPLTDASTKRKEKLPPPPEPIVRSKLRHPLKWTLQTLALIIAGVVGAHIGKFVVVALYYLFVEGAGHSWTVTHAWHATIGQHGWLIGSSGIFPGGDPDRHMVRNVFEGLYGGLLGFVLAWNAYKGGYARKCRQPLSRLDRLEVKLRVPNIKDPRRLTHWQLLASPFWVFVYALPGLALAYGLQKGIDAVWHTTLAKDTTGGWVTQLYTSNWYPILAGLFASYFMGKRPVFKVANDIQLWFAERRVNRIGVRDRIGMSEPVEVFWRWYDTPAFKARVTDVRERMLRGEERRSSIGHGGAVGAAMLTLSVITLGFAAYGAYVLTQIATKHH